MNYMNSLCLSNLNNISVRDILSESPRRIYVCDLTHQAPFLIKQARKEGVSVYGNSGRKPKDKDYITICASGKCSPKIHWIEFSNGSKMLNYSSFDTKKEEVPVAEMERIVKQMELFVPSLNWTTSNSMIKTKIGPLAEFQTTLLPCEEKIYNMLYGAFRGGANYTKKITAPIELHLDYHQLYGYIMMTKEFPCGRVKEVEGYYPHPYAIYWLETGTRARVKKDGYSILPIGGDVLEGMAGANGERFDIGETLQFISQPDLELLLENYEFDNSIAIKYTIYYEGTFKGSKHFKPIIEEIYNKRIAFKGQPEERFFKIMNEVLPGHFERTEYDGGFWKKDFEPNPLGKSGRYNPKVGIFITAYGRQLLNKLLHMFPHDKVIGYDTDCVFFEGTMEEVPQEVLDLIGDAQGQIHEDGYYVNVVHKASKFYYGFDKETGEYFEKTAGVSKSGKAWKWNKDTKVFDLVEVKDETRQLAF